MTVGETEIALSYPGSQFHIPGYSIHRSDKAKGGGGIMVFISSSLHINNHRKHDVYGKRQTAKIELLVSDFSRLYNLGKLFAFTVIKGFFSYFSTGFI